MAERDGLENRCTLTGTEGSNPSLSANNEEGSLHVASFFLLLQLIKMSYFEQRGSPQFKIFYFSPAKSSLAMPYRGLQALVGGDLGLIEGLERGGCGNLG